MTISYVIYTFYCLYCLDRKYWTCFIRSKLLLFRIWSTSIHINFSDKISGFFLQLYSGWPGPQNPFQKSGKILRKYPEFFRGFYPKNSIKCIITSFYQYLNIFIHNVVYIFLYLFIMLSMYFCIFSSYYQDKFAFIHHDISIF